MIKKLTASYIQEILEAHLNPDTGSDYWCAEYGIKGYEDIEKIHSFESFKRLFSFDFDQQRKFEAATRNFPVENFIPKSVQMENKFLWVSQTGGTTGRAKHGTWGEEYWDDVIGFSKIMMQMHDLDGRCNWLFIGPTGPHTTGRWAISLAESFGGKCFTIDLDPRIVRIFDDEEMYDASKRYREHIWSQVRDVVNSQNIGIIFTTSKLLELLPEVIGGDNIEKLRGILHAGTKIEEELDNQFHNEVLERKPLIGVYGTSTTSVSFQKSREDEDDGRIIYIPSSPHLYIDVVDDDGNTVSYGDEGNLSTYRFTMDSLIPGFWERDKGNRIEPYGRFRDRFLWDWVESPFSPIFENGSQAEGVY